ncbi:MAG: ABC transporter substrate-binding protein [Deltaproteobacteria bacterium]|nr:ABC transporter substrate-binding protein [Deltaproteobacteria bacterium]
MMQRRTFLASTAAALAASHAVGAQSRIPRLGVIMHGGPYAAAINGLRDGLKVFGMEERAQFVFNVRDTKGDPASVAAAARSLEAEKVDLIFAVTTGATLAAMQNTTNVPIVFYAGSDPMALGLIESFAKPGVRLTGVYSRFADLPAKRLQLLTEIIPGVRRVLTFFNPSSPVNQRSAMMARDAARQLKIEIVERPVESVEKLQASLRAIQPGEVDAFFNLSDALVISRAGFVAEAALAINLPTMFADKESVSMGVLAGYGGSYYEAGRLAARHVRSVVLGANPGNVPVEQYDRLGFFINLKTAKALGLRIPPALQLRADEVIE